MAVGELVPVDLGTDPGLGVVPADGLVDGLPPGVVGLDLTGGAGWTLEAVAGLVAVALLALGPVVVVP